MLQIGYRVLGQGIGGGNRVRVRVGDGVRV